MQNESKPVQTVNHVFVDLENVKTVDLTALEGKNLTFQLFLGPQNKKLDVDVVERLLANAQAMKLVRSPKAGKNALDFVLAYHLGQAVMGDPHGYFHIVSKDTGFDALVELLKSRKVKVKRHADWDSLHATMAPQATAPKPVSAAKKLSPEAEKVLSNLRKAVKQCPKRKKTLVSHTLSFLGKGANEAKAESVIEELRSAGYLAIDEKGALIYRI